VIDYGYCQSELSWGTVAQLGETEIRRILQTIKDLGGSRVRFGVQLGSIDDTDLAVRLSREYGLKPLLCLINNSAFGYNGSVDSFGTFCTNIATRYGPLGVGVYKNAITEVELFNEANSSLNPPSVDPANFVKYLKAGYQAIKAVHSSCTVIAGGTIPAPDTWIPFIGVAYNPVSWYTQILAAGGGQWFDAWGFHLYADSTPSPDIPQWKYLTDVRDLMVANGLGAKKAWITEVGVGYPAPGVSSLLQARDWLKIMIDGLLGYAWVDKFFIYNLKCYSAGDGGGGTYGMIDVDYSIRSPIYEYAKTIAGAPSDPGDIVPPSNPTGLVYSDVTSTSAQFTWNPNPSVDGVTNYRLKTLAGAQLGDTTSTHFQATGLPSGMAQSFYVTAVDAAGLESGPSNTVTLTTDVPTGLQADFAYQFSGSTVPTVFTQLGLGFTVSSGVALPNAPTSNGKYVTVAPYYIDMQSVDHSCRISLAATASAADRTALAIIRGNSDGTQWVAAASPGGGNADSLIIYLCDGGKLRAAKAMNTIPAKASDDLFITVSGNVYTARIISSAAVVKAELSWTDTNNIFPGVTNRRTGFGWRHTRSKSINYPPPGVTHWSATDVGAVQGSGGVRDAWMFAVTDEPEWAQVIATGLWETAI